MAHVTRWLWSTQLKPQFAKIGRHCPSEGGDQALLKKSRDHMINGPRESVGVIASS